MKYPVNQCDGCRRKLPLRDGTHYNPDSTWDSIRCTAKLYGQEPGDTSATEPLAEPRIPENVARLGEPFDKEDAERIAAVFAKEGVKLMQDAPDSAFSVNYEGEKW